MNFDGVASFWAAHFSVPATLLVSAGLAIGVLVLGEAVYRLIFALLHRFSRATKTALDDILVRHMRAPARILVGLFAVHAFLVMRGQLHPTLRSIVAVSELLIAAYLAVEITETLIIHYWFGERKGVEVPAVVRHLLLVVLYSVAALSIIGSVTGINLVPLLATSTVVTVVVGLALQDTLGNLLSGLAIHAEKPFGVGDWILVDGIEGQVVYMGWRSTRLRTFNAEIVSLPNSVIARARVHNFYAPDKLCGRNVEVLVSNAASPEAVELSVRRACGKVPLIREDPAAKVWLISMTPLFQRYIVKIWIDDFRHHDDIESDFMKAVWVECRVQGIELQGVQPSAAVDPNQPATVIAAVPPPHAAGPVIVPGARSKEMNA